MTVHIKVGDQSWCQWHIPTDLSMRLFADRESLQCSYCDQREAARHVAVLRKYGVEARVVEGGCDQRDLDYYDD